MSYPEKMSAPDPARNEICDAIAVSPTGKAAPDHDKLNPKPTTFKSPNTQRGATEFPNDKKDTPSTGDNKRENKDLMDNLHMKLIDNEQIGDTRKQLRFNEEARWNANMKDVQKLMAEMQTKRMAERVEMRKQLAEMMTIIEQQRVIIEQQRAWMNNFISTLNNFMKVVETIIERQRDEPRQQQKQEEGEEQQGEQQEEEEQQQQKQEEQKQEEGEEQQGEQQQEEQQQQQKQEEQKQEEGEEKQGEQQQQQAATAEVAAAMVARADKAEAAAAAAAVMTAMAVGADVAAATAGVRMAVVAATVTVRHASARADRRQAALQRQEREREEQQRVEQLRDREPKVTRATPARATLRYLTREIGPVDSHGDRFDISLERSDERPTLSQTGCLSPLPGDRGRGHGPPL